MKTWLIDDGGYAAEEGEWEDFDWNTSRFDQAKIWTGDAEKPLRFLAGFHRLGVEMTLAEDKPAHVEVRAATGGVKTLAQGTWQTHGRENCTIFAPLLFVTTVKLTLVNIQWRFFGTPIMTLVRIPEISTNLFVETNPL